MYGYWTNILWRNDRHTLPYQMPTSVQPVEFAEIFSWNFSCKCLKKQPCAVSRKLSNACDTKLTFYGGTTKMHYLIKYRHLLKQSNSPKSSPETFLLSSPQKRPSAEPEKITVAITNMIIKGCLPLSAVNGEGFKELFGLLAPNFKSPSRNTVNKIASSATLASKKEWATDFIRQTKFCVFHYRYMDFQNNRELHLNNRTYNWWMEYWMLCIVYSSDARESYGFKLGVKSQICFQRISSDQQGRSMCSWQCT